MEPVHSNAADSFAYYGEREGWLQVIGQHRDSGILDISNFETISSDMQERFPDDTAVERFNHFLVGWTEVLLVNPANATAVKAAEDWQENLADYPVADEDDYSRREYEDALETLEHAYGIPAESCGDVFSWLFNNYSRSSGEDYRQDEVDEACNALGIAEAE